MSTVVYRHNQSYNYISKDRRSY